MSWMLPRLSEVSGVKQDGVSKWSGELDLLAVRIQGQVKEKVDPLFARMSREVSEANAKAVAQVIGVRENALGVGAQILAAREANIRLVEDAGRAYATQVREVFESPDSFGLRVEELKAALLKRGDVSEARAELIARDQTLSLNASITKARQQNAGVTEYTWSTSGDDRVRPEHAALEGQTFRWDTPPEPDGHPGEGIQCRCTAIPVVAELEGI